MKNVLPTLISLKTYLFNYFAFKRIALGQNYFQSLVAKQILLHPFNVQGTFTDMVQSGHSEFEEAAFEVAEELNIIIEFSLKW